MTERRPHWDASLISAVLADLRDVYDSGYGEEQAFRIIAAVEDWVYDNFQGGEYDNPVEYTPEELAIQRVRELHGRHDPNCPYGEDCAGAGLCLACREEYPCATIRALDGLEGRIDD